MRILIVDDETLTRRGLMDNIPWDELAIDEIEEAADGMQGLSLARKKLPDLVLTDVRMPRMDGIEMASAIQKLSRECPVIFMSGYSDKEYLKAAIKLHAVRYVEKPIVLEEITDALAEAVSLIQKKKRQLRSEEMLRKESASRLALTFTKSGFTVEEELLVQFGFPKNGGGNYSTLILKLSPSFVQLPEDVPASCFQKIHTITSKRGLSEIHAIKQEEYLLLHVYSAQTIDYHLLRGLLTDLKALFSDLDSLYLAAGKPVKSLYKLPESYHSAVILLQSAFFYENGSILTYGDPAKEIKEGILKEFEQDFISAVSDMVPKELNALADSLYDALKENRTLLVNQVKDLYYHLISAVNNAAYKARLFISPKTTDTTSTLSLVAECASLQGLHGILKEYIASFWEKASASENKDNSTVFYIKDYISKNYSHTSLSIKEISDHVHLSASYLCTVFKTETGRTLNQYITEYRLEKAKLLLSDPHIKISEVSSRVGYSDGNYFGKSFKKAVGLSPSEYRERELS